MIRYLKNSLGDFVAGLCLMFDGLLAVISCGTYKSKTALKWTITRVHYNLLIDMPEIEKTNYIP